MQPQDLAYLYSAKTDEELLHLATEPEQLTPEALRILRGELSRRRIDFSRESKPDIEDESRSERSAAAVARKSKRSHRVSEFIPEVLRLYHGHFSLFLKLTAPAVVMGYFAVMLARYESRHIFRSLPKGSLEFILHQPEILEMWFINISGYFISWLVFSLSFAAICSAIDHIDSEIPFSVGDSLVAVRERFWVIFRLSLVLFFIALALLTGSTLVGIGIAWALPKIYLHATGFLILITSYITIFLGLLILSRFSLAMPAVVLDDCRVIPSLFRSDELTKGKWLVLAALLSKSLVGGYVAGMLPFWIRVWIWDYVKLPSTVATMASVAAVTVVEPTMFIGFALLYLQMTAKGSGLPLAPLELAAQHFKEI